MSYRVRVGSRRSDWIVDELGTVHLAYNHGGRLTPFGRMKVVYSRRMI